jgi:hypothetical protein
MGYKEGFGIGKDLQGRVEPVQAVLRKGKFLVNYHKNMRINYLKFIGKGAIGAYGNEGGEKNKSKKRNFLNFFYNLILVTKMRMRKSMKKSKQKKNQEKNHSNLHNGEKQT